MKSSRYEPPVAPLAKRGRIGARSALTNVAIACLMALTFWIDTVTNLEIAAAVFYIIAILLAVRRFSHRHVVGLAGLCILLTVLSALFTPKGTQGAGPINTAISICAIAATTYLALRMVAAEAAMHEARAQLLRVTRITSIGELTASIAHELNQPLASVAASGGACLRWLDQDPPQLAKARASAERAVADAHRASDVLQRVRSLARNKSPQLEIVELNPLVLESLTLAQGEIDRHGIALRTDLCEGLPPIRADRIQLQQVVGNLLLNAIESLTAVASSKRALTVSSKADETGLVVLSVADSGPGLPADAQERIFEAFWTTKDGGTGLGLTISRAIVEAHGGRIWMTTDSRSGTTFHIALPVAAP